MKEKLNSSNFIMAAVTILLAVVLFTTLATMASESAQDLRATANTSGYALSIATVSSNVSLGHTGTSLTSIAVTRNNDTWLDFDGVNDHVNITDYSYITYSLWYRNRTGPDSAWQHIVNTSNILYKNGTQVTTFLYHPIHLNDTQWVIGMSNETEFFNGTIDSIKFFNDTINESVVDTIYSDGRLLT